MNGKTLRYLQQTFMQVWNLIFHYFEYKEALKTIIFWLLNFTSKPINEQYLTTIKTRLESKVLSLERLYPSPPVEVSESQTNIGSEKNVGSEKKYGPAERSTKKICFKAFRSKEIVDTHFFCPK